jgi:hypothetical protein
MAGTLAEPATQPHREHGAFRTFDPMDGPRMTLH